LTILSVYTPDIDKMVRSNPPIMARIITKIKAFKVVNKVLDESIRLKLLFNNNKYNINY
jgi:hypothetical protein